MFPVTVELTVAHAPLTYSRIMNEERTVLLVKDMIAIVLADGVTPAGSWMLTSKVLVVPESDGALTVGEGALNF